MAAGLERTRALRDPSVCCSDPVSDVRREEGSAPVVEGFTGGLWQTPKTLPAPDASSLDPWGRGGGVECRTGFP